MAINLKNELTKIANAIRGKTGETNTIKPSEFVDKINSISTGLKINGEVKTYPVEVGNTIKEGEFIEITENNTVKPYETTISGVSKTKGTENIEVFVPWSSCFQFEYTDISDVSHEEIFAVDSELKIFISNNKTNLKTAKLSSRGGIKITSCTNLFSGCSNLVSLDLSEFDTSDNTSLWNTFKGCSSLKTLNLNNFDTSNVTDMDDMFYRCSSLTSLDLSNFNTSKVTNLGGMFQYCNKLTELDLSNFDTSNVESMSYMFYSCENLTSLDLSNFDTSKVKNMGSMFAVCRNLSNLNVSSFNTSNVTNMSFMFQFNSMSNLNISNFNTSNVTDMSYMFYYCTKLTELDLTNFNINKVTTTEYMLYSARNLITLYCNDDWNEYEISNSNYMFRECFKLVGAVPYDSSKIDITMANPDTGYFTRTV